MRVQHENEELAHIEANQEFNGSYGDVAARGFRKAMNLIRQAKNEVELHNWKGLRLEKLSGKRNGEHSMRINDQWRLIVAFIPQDGPNNNVCSIRGIDDYH